MSLPLIPVGWDTLLHPQKDRFSKTYNYFNSDEVSSAFQKSVRRGELEAIQWALELYWTGPRYRTNIWNRILVTSVEDVGLACPDLIINLLSLRNADKYETWTTGNCLLLARAAELCVKARKSRANDWAVNAFNSKGKFDHQPLNKMVTGLALGLQCKNAESCLYWADLLWSSSQTLSGHQKAGLLVWMTLSDYLCGKSKTYFDPLCTLALSDNWRWKGKDRLLYTHLILLHCYEDKLDWKANALTNIQIMSEGTLENSAPDTLTYYIKNTFLRQKIAHVPDYSLDMHTFRGRKMGRDLKHFLIVGSQCENKAEELKEIEGYFLNLFLANLNI